MTYKMNDCLEKKLQALALAGVFITQVGSVLLIVPIVCYYILYGSLWWLCLLYITWYLFLDQKSPETIGRRSQWVRDWTWWVYVRNYFPIKMVKLSSTPLDPKRNYLFCYFPHGLLSTGALISLSTNALNFKESFPNHTPHLHTIGLFFKLPFIRELGLWLGVLSASKQAVNYVLSKPEGGNVSGLVVGGAAEAYYCKPGLHKIYYKNRKGFIKIALKNGSPLVPVYCFGENEVYSQKEVVEGTLYHKFQRIVTKIFGFSFITPRGQGFLKLLPYRRPITIVVGEPIDVQQTNEPTQEQIDELHLKFEKKLLELFESQKKHYIENWKEVQLIVT